MYAHHPTTDSNLNVVLQQFVASARLALGGNFIGAYLQGSFAVGDWDVDSDVDFLVAVEHDVSEADLPALQAMHASIYHLDSPWAQHLEGSYFPRAILRRRDLERTPLLFLDNGSRELIRLDHDNKVVVRWVVRECGITLAGPDPRELIDPISGDEVRQDVLGLMRERAEAIFGNRYRIDNRWAQPFIILTFCRMLHSLETGRVGSKRAGAEWAQRALDSRWVGLIQRAWDERPDPSFKVRQPADPDAIEATRAFIHYALALSGQEDVA